MTETDNLVTIMRQQAKTYIDATCAFTTLESEWVEVVTKHNKFIEERRPGFTYALVKQDRFDDLFKYLSSEWECDCKCEHVTQDYDLDTYWDDIRKTSSCEKLHEEIEKGKCKCDFITQRLKEAEDGTREMIDTLKRRLVSYGASIYHGV